MKAHLIIGASAAGLGALNGLRMLDPDAEIICVADQTEYPYNTCLLADYAAGSKNKEQISLLSPTKAQEKRLHMLLGKRVVQVMPNERCVLLSDGQRIAYDTLLVATGTRPAMPPIPGNDGGGVFSFHRLSDVQAMHAYIQRHAVKKIVVIGAGLSGLEAADAFLQQGLQVAVVERSAQVLSGLVPMAAAQLVHNALHAASIDFYTQETVVEIRRKDGAITGTMLASGKVISADMIIIAVGIQPQDELMRDAGIALNAHGVSVDEYMQTSLKGIYAAGDVVTVMDQLTGLQVASRTWPDAMFQGLVAAHTMAGVPKRYPGATIITSSAFFGLKVASCGYAYGFTAPHDDLVQYAPPGEFNAFSLESGRLRGFVQVGATLDLHKLKKMVLTGQIIDKKQLCGGF